MTHTSDNVKKTQALIEKYAPLAGLSTTAASACAHETELVLAPMAGVSGPAYRLLNRLGGCTSAYSEMISCAGLLHDSAKSRRLMAAHPLEKKLHVQLFAGMPRIFQAALPYVLQTAGESLAGIDINMACPVKKVVSKGEGAALLADPERAFAIVRAVREELGAAFHISVKCRLGIDEEHKATPAFFEGLLEAGATEILIHGRFAKEFYRGSARSLQVCELAKKFPSRIGLTGDVLDAKTAQKWRKEAVFTKVLIARGSYGNPWLAQDVKNNVGAKHTLAQKLYALELLVRFMDLFEPERGRIRLYATHFLKGFDRAPHYRNLAMQCRSAEQYLSLLAEIREHYA